MDMFVPLLLASNASFNHLIPLLKLTEHHPTPPPPSPRPIAPVHEVPILEDITKCEDYIHLKYYNIVDKFLSCAFPYKDVSNCVICKRELIIKQTTEQQADDFVTCLGRICSGRDGEHQR
ncbi:unnamed protein product [Nippostrongylus brasiliensis]|uniref:Uncharacterized protein n=1 Tax=Nippostrongylus brasiliensis TaxID=27835 RepID=A0A0N4XGY5_NIPBR|nr:hypothetical protein Q1695_004257 [Nippostrongylus brasiliensis]VDL65379.1 unnamed protein product [Nippostrongylus brasiliensis]